MFKKGTCLFALALLSLCLHRTMCVQAVQTHTYTQAEFKDKMVRSVILGLMLGASSGSIYAEAENKILGVTLIGWFIEGALRHACVREISTEIQRHKIDVSPVIVSLTAWAADWVAYLIRAKCTLKHNWA